MKHERKLYFDYASYMKAKKHRKAGKKSIHSNHHHVVTTDLHNMQR